jgi:hypothetical protein
LRDEDSPQIGIRADAGSVNDTYSSKDHYREFVRVEIGGIWYRISDWQLIRVNVFFRKASEAEESMDWNNDGDMDDEIWVLTPDSISDESNAEFSHEI